MVLYFTSNVVDPPVTIYMGKDKFENEDLIKYGFPEDFHVDKLSSAHVYVRLQPGQTWLDIPPEVVDDCAQLVKANSIEGNKKNNITVIYTPWDNLKKTPGMETGQVTFHNHKKVKRVHVEKRINEVVNRLNKTKVERYPDLMQEKIQREKMDRKKARADEFAQKEEARRLAEEKRRAEKEINDLFDPSLMKSNWRETEVEDINAAEEDFM
ncbi:Coiled-coil domain-containing protein 25 [Rhizopus azygosporus]|uniref:Coiled-coil domain-containing protein 25 n=1 Tax=Rhizopus azygosporus TaxID=86630 RepID=A0A367IXK2_RHIAZ|nr:Coiled-coil domain-containing protein 25 [Rhizopus azygosporus]